MEKLNIQFASKTTELSEYKNYFEITTRLCYMDKPNLNNVALIHDENSDERIKTLIDMPIQAKYTVNENGEPDLSDHCVSIDENGNYSFSTASIGVHTNAWIADDTITTTDGELVTLPCVFAKAKIWKRYPNYCAAVKRLYESGRLATSWELVASKYEYDNGIKYISDFVFEANCLLGSDICAAYEGTSKVLEMSAQEKNAELLVASALATDLAADLDNNTAREEEDILKKNKENKIAENEEQEIATEDASTIANEPKTNEEVASDTNEEIGEEPAGETELSALTSDDLYRKLRVACQNKLDCWGWIAYWFPNEMTIWFKSDKDATDLDLQMFTYTVEGDEISLSEPTAVKLSVSVASINDVLAEKNDALVSANIKIEELTSQIGELSPFKEAFEQAQAEKLEAEKEAKIEKMRKDAEDSKCFSSEELESEDMEKIFSSIDESALKSLIADKVLEKLRETTPDTTKTETSSVKADLVNDEGEIDRVSAFRKFILKK